MMSDRPTYEELEKRIRELERADKASQKEIVVSLRESEEKFRIAFDASPDAVNINRLEDGLFVDINAGFSQLTGFNREDVIGKTSLEINIWHDPEMREKLVRGLQKNGYYDNLEAKFRRKDGSLTTALMSARVILLKNVPHIISITRDISDRIKAEEAVREGEKRFRDLVSMLPVAVFETDSDLKLTFANRYAFELFGYSEADLENGITGFDLIAPEDQKRAMLNKSRRLEGEDPGMVEYQAKTKDGTTFPTLLRATPISKDGEILGLRGIIVDISDRKHQEAEHRKVTDQLRQAQKMESIGRLAGGVAHDLNNMLSPIIGYSELLMHDFDPADNSAASVSQILGAALRARDLVQQLLAFSRKQTLEYKPVNFNTVLTNFEMLLRRTIREDISIEIIPSSIEPVVMADAGQIEQVIMNLAVNAQDAMPGGGRLVFEIGIANLDNGYVANHPGSKPGHHAVLTVSDNGVGMDAETRELLFEPFFSTKGEEGTGLGLATVYGIVKQHGGNIWVYSEKGMGTTFKIYLPMPEKRVARIAPDPKTIDDLKGSETILITEDDEHVRHLAHDILKRQGYTILLAKNGTEALKLLREHLHPVHLLLTDVVMPEVNGKELYSLATAIKPDLKVIYMSGYTDNIIVHHGVLDKGVAFIQKPFTADTLSSRVREILNDDETRKH